jgi:CBS domain-containing protein
MPTFGRGKTTNEVSAGAYSGNGMSGSEEEASMATSSATVRDAMSDSPRSVSKDATAAEAAQLMVSVDVGSLPVVEGDSLVGIVTDRDLVAQVLARDRDPHQTTVGEVCTREPTVVSSHEQLDAALQRMAREQVRRLPVVDDGRLVGMLSQADVARAASPEATGQVVEEISQG